MRFPTAIEVYRFASICACCLALGLLLDKTKHCRLPEPTPIPVPDKIVDIWINRMQPSFFVFLPDHTARIYESYSFDLMSLGQWQKVDDRPIYPESPKINLPSYRAKFDDDRVIEVFLYPIFHHYSIVIEDKISGHHGYNRLADTDDPNGFYRRKFAQGLSEDLSIVDGYWRSRDGRPRY
jgi:hypothetical protein